MPGWLRTDVVMRQIVNEMRLASHQSMRHGKNLFDLALLPHIVSNPFPENLGDYIDFFAHFGLTSLFKHHTARCPNRNVQKQSCSYPLSASITSCDCTFSGLETDSNASNGFSSG
jgi:hypothetical protein